MAIYEYDDTNPHPGQFEGLRVVVKCYRSGYLQRYFRFRRDDGEFVSLTEERRLRREAELLDRQWRERQARENRQRIRDARQLLNAGSPTATGVAGIRMTFVVDTKLRAGRVVRYYTPAFVVHGSHRGQRFSRTVRVQPGTVTQGWSEAVQTYCWHKGIDGSATRRLLRRQPPVAQFEAVRSDLCRRLGYEIQKERVPFRS